MQKVASVLKFISTQRAHSTPALMTLVNYMQHFCSEDEHLTPSLLSQFFRDCSVYPHWVQNRKALRDEIEECLRRFEALEKVDLNLSEVVWPTEIQVIEVEHKNDFLDVINSYLTFQYQKTGSKFRLVQESEKMLYALILHADQSFSVRQFDRRLTIRNGALEPLRTDLQVHYTANLELETDLQHRLEIAPFVTCRFFRTEDLVSAQLVRGYVFQKFHEFKSAHLETYPRLFYTLKRIEQFFIRRETDPFYTQLTQDLERALHSIRMHEPLDPNSLMELQVRTQNALEYVFHGDKLLTLLLRELRSQISHAQAPKATSLAGSLAQLDFIQDPTEGHVDVKQFQRQQNSFK